MSKTPYQYINLVGKNLKTEVTALSNALDTKADISSIETTVRTEVTSYITENPINSSYPVLSAEGSTVINVGYPYGDVRRYGAVGDGVTDDGPSIQNAIQCNEVVTFPSGTFKVNNILRVNYGNCKIVGTNSKIVVGAGFDYNPEDYKRFLFETGPATETFWIEGVSIEMDLDKVEKLVELQNTENYNGRELWFDMFRITGTKNFTIKNCTLTAKPTTVFECCMITMFRNPDDSTVTIENVDMYNYASGAPYGAGGGCAVWLFPFSNNMVAKMSNCHVVSYSHAETLAVYNGGNLMFTCDDCTFVCKRFKHSTDSGDIAGRPFAFYNDAQDKDGKPYDNLRCTFTACSFKILEGEGYFDCVFWNTPTVGCSSSVSFIDCDIQNDDADVPVIANNASTTDVASLYKIVTLFKNCNITTAQNFLGNGFSRGVNAGNITLEGCKVVCGGYLSDGVFYAPTMPMISANRCHITTSGALCRKSNKKSVVRYKFDNCILSSADIEIYSPDETELPEGLKGFPSGMSMTRIIDCNLTDGTAISNVTEGTDVDGSTLDISSNASITKLSSDLDSINSMISKSSSNNKYENVLSTSRYLRTEHLGSSTIDTLVTDTEQSFSTASDRDGYTRFYVNLTNGHTYLYFLRVKYTGAIDANGTQRAYLEAVYNSTQQTVSNTLGGVVDKTNNNASVTNWAASFSTIENYDGRFIKIGATISGTLGDETILQIRTEDSTQAGTFTLKDFVLVDITENNTLTVLQEICDLGYFDSSDKGTGLILTDSAGGKWVLSVSTQGEVTIQALGE